MVYLSLNVGACCNSWLGGPGYACACIPWKLSAKSALTCDVINFTAECNVKNATYKDGEYFYIPQNPIHYNDIGCKVCSCDRGATTCPNKAKCDVFSKFPCEKLLPAPQGKCCPTCGKFMPSPHGKFCSTCGKLIPSAQGKYSVQHAVNSFLHPSKNVIQHFHLRKTKKTGRDLLESGSGAVQIRCPTRFLRCALVVETLENKTFFYHRGSPYLSVVQIYFRRAKSLLTLYLKPIGQVFPAT